MTFFHEIYKYQGKAKKKMEIKGGKMKKKPHMKDYDLEDFDNDLAFMLWKAELNKELSSFWKSLINNK